MSQRKQSIESTCTNSLRWLLPQEEVAVVVTVAVAAEDVEASVVTVEASVVTVEVVVVDEVDLATVEDEVSCSWVPGMPAQHPTQYSALFCSFLQLRPILRPQYIKQRLEADLASQYPGGARGGRGAPRGGRGAPRGRGGAGAKGGAKTIVVSKSERAQAFYEQD